jgi:hypothetical protein
MHAMLELKTATLQNIHRGTVLHGDRKQPQASLPIQ